MNFLIQYLVQGDCIGLYQLFITINIIIVSFIFIRKRFYLSHIYRNRLSRPLVGGLTLAWLWHNRFENQEKNYFSSC